ncbi:hypothetical protein LVJ82_13345 [Vitreoscilla massiliensis]|uniref:TM2 domain-containing protein n=1 Tax=Vitreoscilla massiliensis TaxID=1689272 RepID=A0ABY4DZ93_9NEIS|nr:hypothetical protein [Vitreoscilla massiliensis]UOO88445.1 hypothetical protein LVJ82_13345 [Vitreoscilla massiliensis]
MDNNKTGFTAQFDPAQIDKAEALATAKKFQQRLLLSKALYPYVFLFGIAAFCHKYLHLPLPNVVWGWLFGIAAVWIVYSIISTLVLGICPYCQQFQKLNGQTLGVDAQSVSYSKGVSPFIHRCNRCAAPLSVKAVNQDYAA